nr:MAG TPA: tail assembly chaperone protein [Caudoviricetes sp.]
MAKLSDLVNININRDTIQVQGVNIPVIFTFKSFPFVEEAYGKPYHIFEKDINRMLQKGTLTLGKNEVKLMNALIYAMVRSGGTECTPYELETSIPLNDLPAIFETAFHIFNNQNFQRDDMEKIKTEKK